MKRNELYILKQVKNEYFLIPTGQAVVSCSSIVKINETGVFIWNALINDISIEQLKEHVLNEYDAKLNEQINLISSDVENFVTILTNKGMIIPDFIPNSANNNPYKITIAGINLNLYIPNYFISSSLSEFASKDYNNTEISENVNHAISINVNPTISVYAVNGLPKVNQNGNIIIRTGEVLLVEANDYYTLVYTNLKYIKEIHISKNFDTVKIYYLQEADNTNNDELCREFTLSLRTPFLLKALTLNKVMLHSSSIIYNDKVYCFSAPSGVGKSTHAALWNKLFHTPIFNGDLNLIDKSGGGLVVHGTPWCGTSGIFSNKTLELGGIVFLRQGHTNEITALGPAEAFEKFMARIITPGLNKEMAQGLINLCSDYSRLVPMYSLVCTADNEAAVIAKKGIDKH